MIPQTIALITRTKDRPRLLERALKSILSQTRQDWSLVVVNSGEHTSVDALLKKYASEFAGRVQHVTVAGDSTIGAMTNVGIAATQSRFITLLDDDDTWESSFLETMVGALEQKLTASTAGAVCHSLCIEEETDAEGTFVPAKQYLQNPGLRNVSLGLMAVMNQFCVHAFVFERAVLEKVGLYDESLPVLDDWDFNLRFLRHFDIQFVPQPLARYHLRPACSLPHEVNSQYHGQCLHPHYEAMIINKALRADLDGHGGGLGLLLTQAAAQREILLATRTFGRRLDSMSKKIGQIDSRTKFLKGESSKRGKNKG